MVQIFLLEINVKSVVVVTFQSKTKKMRRKKSRVPTWKRSRTVPEKLTFLEVTSIVDLPELALINIFKYLSLNEVENCYLACPKTVLSWHLVMICKKTK